MANLNTFTDGDRLTRIGPGNYVLDAAGKYEKAGRFVKPFRAAAAPPASAADVAALQVSQDVQNDLIDTKATKVEVDAIAALVAANTDKAIVTIDRQVDRSLLVTYDDTTVETIAPALLPPTPDAVYDTALSTTSSNAVENKVVKAELDLKAYVAQLHDGAAQDAAILENTNHRTRKADQGSLDAGLPGFWIDAAQYKTLADLIAKLGGRFLEPSSATIAGLPAAPADATATNFYIGVVTDGDDKGLYFATAPGNAYSLFMRLKNDWLAGSISDFTDAVEMAIPKAWAAQELDTRTRQIIFEEGDEIDLKSIVNATLTNRRVHAVNNSTVLDLTVGNERDRAAVWNVDTNTWTMYRHDGTTHQPDANDHEHNVLENIAVYIFSAGSNNGSTAAIEFFDSAGAAYPATDWTVSSGPAGVASRTGNVTAPFADQLFDGTYEMGWNKNDFIFFKYIGDNANGLSAVGYVGTDGAASDGRIIVNFVGTNYHVDFPNKGAVKTIDFEAEAPAPIGNGLRGAPVDDIAALKLLTARDGERRYVKAKKSDYHFKLTADLTTAEITSPSSEADDAATGKWIRESFAALVDGYTYSGIDVANSSFGSGAISFKSSSFNEIYDPKGLVDTDNSFNITIDSPEKAGAYMMALNVTSGSVSGRVNARVNGNTKLIASGEDSADSDAAMGVVELVEGDVVTLAVTGGGTTYGVSFTMSQTRRFVDETQYVSTDQLEPVADNSRIVATGFGPSGGTAHADITTFTVPEDGDYEYETNVEGFHVNVLAWNKTLQVRDAAGGGGNLIMSEALTMGASATTGIRKMASPEFGTVTLQAGVTYTTRLIHVNEFTDQLSPVTLILRKVPKTVEVLDTNLIPADTTEVGTPLRVGSDRHYVMQWDGAKLVNTLALEVWTEGTVGNSGYRKYMVDHLLGHARINGRNVITSSGTISWNLDFALASAYVLAHDLREAQAETASLRINSRTVNSLQYTLHDSVGTGDGGSNVQFELSGEL